jgi:Fe-S cluster assembly ATP-binding protein
MLEIENLHATVDGKEILKGISLSINAGEIHAIMGPERVGQVDPVLRPRRPPRL